MNDLTLLQVMYILLCGGGKYSLLIQQQCLRNFNLGGKKKGTLP